MGSFLLGWWLAAVTSAFSSNGQSKICGGLLPTASDSVVVITHQVPPLHAATVKRFTEDPRFGGLPIVLVNDFPEADLHRDFSGLEPSSFPHRDRVSVFRSTLGEISRGLIRAGTVYLAGGACGVCLTKTLRQLLADAASLDQAFHRFVIFPRLTYGDFDVPPPALSFLKELLPGYPIRPAQDAGAPIPEAEVFALGNYPAENRVRLEVVPF